MIPVFWWEGIAGLYASEGQHGRSRYACCGLLNDCFDQYDCEHFSGYADLKNKDFAVVVIHGGHLRHQVEEINQSIANLSAVLCIGMGDEEADFPYHELRHRNMKLWQQSPRPGKSKADKFILVGYPCDIHEHLHTEEFHRLDWFFAGQVNHSRREECAVQLRQMQNGKLLETKQFYAGMEHAEYFRILGQTKVIPCPSGPECCDTFRLAEALEAGCIPIIDEHPGWHAQPSRGFWNMVFPQGYPFPLLQNWSELPSVMERLLADYDNQARLCREFWADYKKQYFSWLGTDLKSLGVNV